MYTSRSRYIILALTHAFLLLLGLAAFSKQPVTQAASMRPLQTNKFPTSVTTINTGSWISETIDTIRGDWFGENTSIAIDNNGYPHITYFGTNNTDLLYTRWNGSSWITDTAVSTGNPQHAAYLALDGNNYPHISYYDSGLKYAHWDGVVWMTSTIATGGYYNSIAVDSSGIPHISYSDSNDYLSYAHWNGSTWVTEMIDNNGDMGGNIIIKIDGQDYPHIGYRYDDTPYLKYIQWDGFQWIIETAATGYIHANLSFALDTQDSPHFSYYGWLDGDLNYAHKTGEAWNSTTIDSAGYVGKSNSLAIDTNDYPHISYYNGSNETLIYANWNGTNWITTTVDATGNVGQNTSLALDNLNNPHISYFDATNGTLKYATRTTVILDKHLFLPLITSNTTP